MKKLVRFRCYLDVTGIRERRIDVSRVELAVADAYAIFVLLLSSLRLFIPTLMNF